MLIDTHCHLDAPEFAADVPAVLARARAAGVAQLVLPAVLPAQFEPVRALAHQHGLAYALGIHPLYVTQAGPDALPQLAQALHRWRDDPRLVAVGEIGLDHFVPDLDRGLQQACFLAQLRLARDAGLPVLLHLRHAADAVLAGLRRIGVSQGVAHAFNGSWQQAQAWVAQGCVLGFGGALTFSRALNLRRLAAQLPPQALVLETDAPDIPPQWLYRSAAERAAGQFSRNEPAELPRIAAELAALRGVDLAVLAAQTSANALRVLPRLAGLGTMVAAA